MKYTAAPCVYIESEFHDVAIVAKWIIEHVEDIAEAICKGICAYFDVKYVADEPVASSTCSVKLRTLRKGMSGNDVRAAMLILKDRGYYSGTIPASDKLFGPKMLAAVKEFQKAKGSKTCDGIIGAWTWKMLLGE